MEAPRYEYRCAKCGGSVGKDPCQKGISAGLGGWSCATCGRGVKVARKLRKADVEGTTTKE